LNAIKDINSWKLFGYFEFPMDLLMKKKRIHTKTTKGIPNLTLHLPKDILQSFGYYKTSSKSKNDWTRDYFHKIV